MGSKEPISKVLGALTSSFLRAAVKITRKKKVKLEWTFLFLSYFVAVLLLFSLL